MSTEPTKKNPVMIRLDQSEDERLAALSLQTGLNKSELVRRCCRYALPKFSSGEVNILDVVAEVGVAA